MNTEVDHINGLKYDNRKKNLRICTRNQNEMNKGLRSNNTSGCTGVVWNKRDNKWEARIGVNNKKIILGLFTNYDEAVKTRQDAEIKYFKEFRYKKR